MNRRGFMRAIAGALVAAPAATALVLRAPQTIQKFEPRPTTQFDYLIGKRIANEFLRVMINQMEDVERHPISAHNITRPQADGSWQYPQHVGVTISWRPDLPFDELCEPYVREAAEAVADHIRDELERGARGLQFLTMQKAQGPEICAVATSQEDHASARFIVATYPTLDADEDEITMITTGRFDALYTWDRQPRRKRHRFLMDPARLPA